jgi:hypothetical protein
LVMKAALSECVGLLGTVRQTWLHFRKKYQELRNSSARWG